MKNNRKIYFFSKHPDHQPRFAFASMTKTKKPYVDFRSLAETYAGLVSLTMTCLLYLIVRVPHPDRVPHPGSALRG